MARVMKVTGQLKEPVLEPCPDRDDLQTLVDDQCQDVKCTRPRPERDDGVSCCHFWAGSDSWQTAQVRVDQINPEKFKYDQYRYQLYAKPTDFDCRAEVRHLEQPPDRKYIPPVTDVRALRQTTVVPVMPGAGGGALNGNGGAGIPVIPSNPGGVPEVTFPMTRQTLGQPDVTTACCVPVVPCQQGFQNLTPAVLPPDRCLEPPRPGRPHKQLGSRRPDPCSDATDCDSKHQQPRAQQAQLPGGACQQSGCGQACGPAPPQYAMPPSNQQGTCCGGLPPVFPSSGQIPHAFNYSPNGQVNGSHQQGGMSVGQGGGHCMDTAQHCIMAEIEDGLNPEGGIDSTCTNVGTFRYHDRIQRQYQATKETQQERRERLTRMSGAYGASLQAEMKGKRFLAGPKDSITLQGNGFSWGGYPKHENKMCYVLERNQRC